MIPFNHLSRMPDDEKARIALAMLRVRDSGRFILGPEVEAFEREWATYCGISVPAVGVASGTDALKIALRACGIGAGDRVLTVANSCQATVTAIMEIGAWPVYCDVGQDGLIDIATAPTRKVAAVLPVHLYGRVCDMTRVFAFAQDAGTAVVEDCCQAHGERRGIPPFAFAGAWAQAWSFYPTKNLACLGDGGAVTTHSPIIADRCREFRNYGLVNGDRWRMAQWGYNSRLDEIQAAILRARLPVLDEVNAQRFANSARYESGLCGVAVAGGNRHIVAIRHPKRDAIAAALKERGIATTIHYPLPTHKQLERSGFPSLTLPETERWCAEVLSLPMGPYITKAEVDAVADAVLKVVESLT